MLNKRSSFTLFLFLTIVISSQAQDNKDVARQLLEVADEIYNNTTAYIQARDAYVQVLDYDPENLKANYMAGLLYLKTVNKEKATPYLLKTYSLDPNYNFSLLYLIGQSYQYGMDFNNAINYYNQYLDKLKSNTANTGKDIVKSEVVEKNIKECNTAIDLTSHPYNYNITNAGAAINSEWPDYGPTINMDESELIFTTRRVEGNTNENVFTDNFPFEDIFISKKENGKWGQAKNIGNLINTLYHESSLSLSKDGKQLYIFQGVNNGDIFVSNLKSNGTWSVSTPLEGAINTKFKETSASISPDGKVVFFASDRPGTLGGSDIFYSIKNRQNRWDIVNNIGKEINTSDDEDFPFIDYDGKTLYFSSKGHEGMGGYDIFKSVYDSVQKQWIKPVNIGFPINTPDDDIAFITTVDRKRGYFSSVRQDGYGYEDIYLFTIPEEIRKIDEKTKEIEKKPAVTKKTVKILIYVRDESGNPIDANVQFRNCDDNYLGPLTRTSEGTYLVISNFDHLKQCTISAGKDGYMFVNENISIPASTDKEQSFELTLILKKLQTGGAMVLHNIYFDFDKATLKPESFVEINKLYDMLAENSRIIAEIAGHTDNRGTKNYNYSLSYRRSKVVVDYLLKKGMDPVKIQAVGYGEDKPMATNDDELDGRALNRRVEFVVLRYIY